MTHITRSSDDIVTRLVGWSFIPVIVSLVALYAGAL